MTILEKITNFYIESHDFNGIPIDDLDKNFKNVKNGLKDLVQEGKIVLNFGDRHPNPHILSFDPESKEEQLRKLEKLRKPKVKTLDKGVLKLSFKWTNCCAYPSNEHLKTIVNLEKYKARPYTAALALGAPQLTYRAFNMRILEFYRNDPRYYYDTNDVNGHISINSDAVLPEQDHALLQTFGFAYGEGLKQRYVAVFLRYLADLTPEHQQRWKLDEFDGKTFLHPDYARTSAGHFPERVSMFDAFCEELRVINLMANGISGIPLFHKNYTEQERPREFGFLTRPTRREYDKFVHLLDKMTTDNLNKDFFKDKCSLTILEEKNGVIKEKQKGTLSLLEEWLNTGRWPDRKPLDEMLEVFKKLHKKRHPIAHVVGIDEWNEQYFSTQRQLMIDVYGAVRTLRLILTNHPRAKGVEVPKWLFEAKIWTY